MSKDFTCVNPTNVQDIRLHFKSLLVITKAVTKYSCAKLAKYFPALTAILKKKNQGFTGNKYINLNRTEKKKFTIINIIL